MTASRWTRQLVTVRSVQARSQIADRRTIIGPLIPPKSGQSRLIGGHRNPRGHCTTDCPVTTITVTHRDRPYNTDVRYPPIWAEIAVRCWTRLAAQIRSFWRWHPPVKQARRCGPCCPVRSFPARSKPGQCMAMSGHPKVLGWGEWRLRCRSAGIRVRLRTQV